MGAWNSWRRHRELVLLLGGLLAAFGLGSAPLGPLATSVLLALVLAAAAGAMIRGRAKTRYRIHAVSNLISSLRTADHSVRVRRDQLDPELALLVDEANALADASQQVRFHDADAGSLVSAAMAELNAGILALDDRGIVRLVNPAAEQLLARSATTLVGRTPTELGIDDWTVGPVPRLMDIDFGPSRRIELTHRNFRREGRPHLLLVLTDVGRLLHQEERAAWVRIVRVLSHEVNNSVAPIQSLAGTLRELGERAERPPDLDEGLRHGLAVIERRAAALGRFIGSFARLATIPPARPAAVDLEELVGRVASLPQSHRILVPGGPATWVLVDVDQIEQLLLNVIRNAAEAMIDAPDGEITISWRAADGGVELRIEDDGPGLAPGIEANLFTPFFTTKPTGSGIGLALALHLAEQQGGALRIGNRPDAPGCLARLWLPVTASDNARPVARTTAGFPSR